MRFAAKLNNILLYGFPNIHWERLFLWSEFVLESGLTNPLKSFFECCYKPFYSKKFEFKKSILPSNRILCIQEASRNTSIDKIKKLSNVVPMDIIQFHSMRKTFHLKKALELLFIYIPSWRRELDRISLPTPIINYIVSILIDLHFFKIGLGPIDNKRYNLLLTYFDAEFFQAYVVELLKTKGVKTATLQHGMFVAGRELDFENSGVELRCFKSDYFLCWNQMTIDEGIKEGIPLDCFVKTGILGYIGSKYQECTKPNNDTFGVVLGHPMFEEENLALIEAANILAKAKGIKYYLKLHPNYIDTHFSKYIEPTLYIGNIAKGIPILEYANMVDFSIVGSSSVFAELVYIQHDVIRYSSGDIKDKYRDIHLGRYFTNPQEIIEVYSSVEETNNKELFDYICSVKDVTASYKSFLMPFTC